MIKLVRQARFLIYRFEPLDMSSVLDIVFRLDFENDIVYFKGREITVCDLCCELYSRHHAKTVDLWFWGGPPDKEEWFQGTLYQFVTDRLMRALISMSSREVIEKLQLKKTNA